MFASARQFLYFLAPLLSERQDNKNGQRRSTKRAHTTKTSADCARRTLANDGHSTDAQTVSLLSLTGSWPVPQDAQPRSSHAEHVWQNSRVQPAGDKVQKDAQVKRQGHPHQDAWIFDKDEESQSSQVC